MGGILLAAGGGRRLGGPKALVDVGGRALVEHGVVLLEAAGCDPVVVVLGAGADDVVARCDLRDARTVVNREWAAGMGTSLRSGLAALEESRTRAAVVILVDQPMVARAALRRLIDAWRGGTRAAVAGYGGMPRNPVVLDRGVWRAVAASATGDHGARVWLRSNPHEVVVVPCDDVARPDDIDTVEDLVAVRAAWQGWRTASSYSSDDVGDAAVSRCRRCAKAGTKPTSRSSNEP